MRASTRGPAINLQRALVGVLAVAMLAGFVPASIVLDRRLVAALEDRTRADLALSPHVLADRMTATSDAMMMHAKDLAHLPGLAEALGKGDRAAALQMIDAARSTLGGMEPVLIGSDGVAWLGPSVDAALLSDTRQGHMPVAMQRSTSSVHRIALAPVTRADAWVGAAGLAITFDDRTAGMLSGLTRAGVVIATADYRLAGTTVDSAIASALLGESQRLALDTVPRIVTTPRGRYLAVAAPLSVAGVVIFARSMDEELAVLPQLRRLAGIAALAALLLALVLGTVLASRVARPVRELAEAASALGDERFTAPLPFSRIREVSRVSAAFDVMRRALAARLDELRRTNETLSDRNAKLIALQADLMQRDRLAATGRLVTQLAHEIRNPVASLRNCMELIRRRVDHDPEATEFADLAIDELLRMHELAEQMLDLNRPRATGTSTCAPFTVATEVARLLNLGTDLQHCRITVTGDAIAEAAIAPDALKQVLLNTVHNAREALATVERSGGGVVEINVARESDSVVIEVADNGPGIADAIAARLFDPFFTTKEVVHGVGLGLFVAEGLVRSAGGTIRAGNRQDGGACFRIVLPVAESPTQARSRVVPLEEAS